MYALNNEHLLMCFFTAFSDELGAVGGTNLEDETHALRLDEDSENPPMVLRTE